MALQVQRVQSPLPHASRREAPLGAASSGPRCSSAVVAVPGVLLLQGAPLVGSSAPLSTRQASPVGHPKCSSSVFAFRSARSRLARARLRPPTLRSSCAPSVRRDAGSAAACLRLRGFRLRRPLCQVRKRLDPFRVRSFGRAFPCRLSVASEVVLQLLLQCLQLFRCQWGGSRLCGALCHGQGLVALCFCAAQPHAQLLQLGLCSRHRRGARLSRSSLCVLFQGLAAALRVSERGRRAASPVGPSLPGAPPSRRRAAAAPPPKQPSLRPPPCRSSPLASRPSARTFQPGLAKNKSGKSLKLCDVAELSF